MKIAHTIPALLLAHHGGRGLMHVFYHLGLAGLVLISTVDSSFVPLPIPGVTDILVILYAANRTNLILLVFLATVGSALGGYLSYILAQAGGMAFLEKHVPARYLNPIKSWVERHSILSVALPAILPPPMPLSPFVLAAGAIKMDRRKFMTAFTILIVFWSVTILFTTIGIWKLVQTSRAMKLRPGSQSAQPTAP